MWSGVTTPLTFITTASYSYNPTVPGPVHVCVHISGIRSCLIPATVTHMLPNQTPSEPLKDLLRDLLRDTWTSQQMQHRAAGEKEAVFSADQGLNGLPGIHWD